MSPQPNRPLSPHLQIYKPQITSVLSILHRGTGIVLFVGAFLWTVWLMALAMGPGPYETVRNFLIHPFGLLLLMGWFFSFTYHLLNGVRHLFWDLGYGYDLSIVRLTGWVVLALSFITTGFVWIVGL